MVKNSEVICFILNKNNQILLQKRSKYEKYNPSKWSFCAGHVEDGDSTIKDAMIREIKEELCINVKNEDLNEIETSDCNTHFYYTIIDETENSFKLQKEELEEVKWCDINEVIEMMDNKQDDIVYSDRLLKVLEKIRNSILKFVKVMFGNSSGADNNLEYKLDEVNIASNWNPAADNPKEMGGFNFSTEDKILRWLVRGDTIYDVIIPDDAEIVEVESISAPHGVFRTNKIIITNPRIMTDELAMYFYKISDLPEKSYYKSLAGCAIRGYKNTCMQIIKDRVNEDNIDLVSGEWNEFHRSGHCNDSDNTKVDSEIFEILNKIKSDSLNIKK